MCEREALISAWREREREGGREGRKGGESESVRALIASEQESESESDRERER